MIIETCISYGHKDLLETFFEANEMFVRVKSRRAYPVDKISLEYDDDSSTAMNLTYMGIVHSGIENMLCDYLMKCGVRADLIENFSIRRSISIDELDDEVIKHLRKIGVCR